MMQIEFLSLWDQIVFSPTFCGPIATTGKESMQHREINGSFYVKLVVTACQYRLNYLLDAAFLPQPAKDKLRSDAQHPDRLSLSGGMRVDEGELFTMTQSRTDQPLELSARFELIQPPQSSVDLLAHLLTLAGAFDNLKILAGPCAFDSEKHRDSMPLQSKATDLAKQYKSHNNPQTWHYILTFSNKYRPRSRSRT